MKHLKNYFAYFPLQTNSSDLDFEITGGGHHRHPPHRPYPSQGHPQSRMFDFESGRSIDSFQILWISRGKGVYRDRHHPHLDIESGQSFLLFPNQWHSYHPDPQTGWEEHWFEFRGKTPEKWLRENKIQKLKPILQPAPDPLRLTLFQELHQLNHLSDQRSRNLRNSLALHLLQRLIPHSHSRSRSPSKNKSLSSPLLSRYRDLQVKMGQKIPSEKLNDWCSSHGVSYHTFRLWFQKENSLSPNQYLSQLRLRKAKEWLLGSSLQIQEIAEKTGFANAFHFSNHFKNKTGLSPKDFRNR